MRVVVTTAIEPFVHDELRQLGLDLAAALRAAGHDVEVIGIPVRPSSVGAVDADSHSRGAALALDVALAERSLVVAQRWTLPEADAVVALAFPAYAVEHPRTTVWLGRARSVTSPLLEAADVVAAAGAVRVLRTEAGILRPFGGVEAPLLEPPASPDGWAAALETLGLTS